MNKDLKVTMVQTSLEWENIDANLSAFSEKLENIGPSSTDLIVLPEMFNTGFTMNATAIAEPVNGKTMGWMAKLSEQKKCVMTGSMVIKENGNFYNRLIWMRPNGTYEYYNKRHLFRMAKENETYTGGDNRLIVELNSWKICPLVCYDLRFPAWSRNIAISHQPLANSSLYDLLIYVANWPERRSYAWRHLLIARAIENQAYAIGVNPIGNDGNGVEHSGYSAVLNPKGEPISNTQANMESIETVSLSYKELEEYRKDFPVVLDADKFRID